MRAVLTVICLAILVTMSWATGRAIVVRSVFDNGLLLADPWFVATLCDAYCGFLLFWCWVAYREGSTVRAVVWLILIAGLGNFAMAGYLLWRVWRLPVDGNAADLLLRKVPSEPMGT